MPDPRPGSPRDGSFPAECAHTHLFAGARCRIGDLPDPAGFGADPVPIGIALHFSDDVTAEAELLVSDRGDLALAVAAHTTAAGTPMTGRVWNVREVRLVADEAEVVLGRPQDPGFPGTRN
ncbi:hypothetical protein ACIREE_25605 [Streptomyces sp. NPDC102467]|uniref:hypothetical protein n=1 Tax=Streptomyces sp. NPDC102467 TaxID=3366179 RepID=UPI00382B417A